MADYKRSGPHKPTGGLGYFPSSPGVPDIKQFHGMLLDAIANRRPRNKPGLLVALHLFEGYFGYFGRKGGK